MINITKGLFHFRGAPHTPAYIQDRFSRTMYPAPSSFAEPVRSMKFQCTKNTFTLNPLNDIIQLQANLSAPSFESHQIFSLITLLLILQLNFGLFLSQRQSEVSYHRCCCMLEHFRPSNDYYP
jgi:hypothetical protein